MLCVDGHNLRTIGLDHDGVTRNQQSAPVLRKGEFDLGVHAWKQLTVAVRDLQLGQQRARRGIERAGSADDSGVERLLRNFAKRDGAVLSGSHRARVGLRNGNVDAECVSLRHVEERGVLTAIAGSDERPVIDIARGYDAGEGRDDLLEALQLF